MILILLSITLVSCTTLSPETTAEHEAAHKVTSARDYGKNVKWHTLAEGTKKAEAEKKPCVVDFFFPGGCPRCDRMDANVYSNPEVAAKLNADFIPILIDLSKPLSAKEQKLGERYDYKNECLLLFMDYKGNVIEDPSGKKLCFADYVDAEWFNKHLDMIVEKSAID